MYSQTFCYLVFCVVFKMLEGVVINKLMELTLLEFIFFRQVGSIGTFKVTW